MGDKQKLHKMAKNTGHLIAFIDEAIVTFNVAQSTHDPISRAEFAASNAKLFNKID